MAKRKAGVNDIIYELDNDDVELSSDDEAKQTKMGRFEDEIRKKQRANTHIREGKEATRGSAVINLDCSSDEPCDTISPNNSVDRGKTAQTDNNQKSYHQNDITVDESKKIEDLQNNTLIFHDHNIIVDSPSNSDLGVVGCENRTPLVTVRFKDRKLAHTYKKRVREFLINLLRTQIHESDTASGDSDVELDIWPEELFEEEFDKVGEVSAEFHEDEAVEEFDDASEVDDSLFFVDTEPCEQTQTDIPKYSQTSSLISNITEETASSPSAVRRGPTCFNCDGAHPLKDCPLPRNHNRIAANRKNMPARVGRYHVEDEQKYGHLVPGRISGNLRHALGLKRYELPLYIYRMRLLGYPPGWLEEARISHSGITLFDSSGNATQDPEEEDGELCEPGSKDKFDIKKILDFPGFNVPASSRYIEEAHLFGLPPMSERDSKMEMLQILAPNAMKAYKRKKLTFFPSSDQKSLLGGQAEMELDSGDEVAEFPSIPPLPDEEPPPPPPPPPTPPPEETSEISDKLSDESQEIDKSNNKGTKKLHEVNSSNEKIDSTKGKDNLTKIKTNTVKGKEKVKKVLSDNNIDLASSSDDELQVIEVMQVPDIPVPEGDLITIDDDDDDDDKSLLSSGPDSPSLAVLEERKMRLLDALKGDSDISIDQLVVLDETFSDSVENEENSEINVKEIEDKSTSETERDGNNTSKTEPEESTVEVDNDSLFINEDLKTPKMKSIDVEVLENSLAIVEADEEIRNTIEISSIENDDQSTKDEMNTSVEKSSILNENVKNSTVDKHSGQSKVTKGTSANNEVSTPDSKAGKVKNTLYGTPVLNVASPYAKLPSDEKFAKDICDVIYFENLPNSTGKFKQISNLLKRVKSAVDKIQDS